MAGGNHVIAAEIDARKEVYTGDSAWQLVAAAEKVVVASGKKVLEFAPATDGRDTILPEITGRTGNLRAPAVQVGKVWYIGFNQEMYQQIFA